MRKLGVVILGVLTAYVPLFLVLGTPICYWYISSCQRAHVHSSPWYVISLLAVVILGISLRIYYPMHLRKNDSLLPEEKKRWRSLLLHFNVFVMPYYWYKFIWKQL